MKLGELLFYQDRMYSKKLRLLEKLVKLSFQICRTTNGKKLGRLLSIDGFIQIMCGKLKSKTGELRNR